MLRSAGLAVDKEWTDFHEQGVLANFGGSAGRWLADNARVELTALGRLLMHVLPVWMTGQMICFVARRENNCRS
jgi:hypothetical protein